MGAEADTETERERESDLRQKPWGSVRAFSETEAMKQSEGRGKLLLAAKTGASESKNMGITSQSFKILSPMSLPFWHHCPSIVSISQISKSWSNPIIYPFCSYSSAAWRKQPNFARGKHDKSRLPLGTQYDWATFLWASIGFSLPSILSSGSLSSMASTFIHKLLVLSYPLHSISQKKRSHRQ